jgi:hypothetical protein
LARRSASPVRVQGGEGGPEEERSEKTPGLQRGGELLLRRAPRSDESPQSEIASELSADGGRHELRR